LSAAEISLEISDGLDCLSQTLIGVVEGAVVALDLTAKVLVQFPSTAKADN